jgi:hypothetical protein
MPGAKKKVSGTISWGRGGCPRCYFLTERKESGVLFACGAPARNPAELGIGKANHAAATLQTMTKHGFEVAIGVDRVVQRVGS